jgi:hypothetical protein
MFTRPKPQMGNQRDVLPRRAAAPGIDLLRVGVLVAAVGFLADLGFGILLVVAGVVVAYAYVV